MKKSLICGAAIVAMVAISGCSDSVKSVEDYQKLSKAELDSMFEECENKLKSKANPLTPDGLELVKEIEEVSKKIRKAGGTDTKKYLGYVGYGLVTDEELSQFGNSKYAEFVECGRIKIASIGGIDELNKPKRSIADKYKDIGKE